MTITKASVKRALGFRTDAELARCFINPKTGRPLTKQAVSRWRDDEPLPDGRQWELRARCPEIFRLAEQGDSASLIQAANASTNEAQPLSAFANEHVSAQTQQHDKSS